MHTTVFLFYQKIVINTVCISLNNAISNLNLRFNTLLTELFLICHFLLIIHYRQMLISSFFTSKDNEFASYIRLQCIHLSFLTILCVYSSWFQIKTQYSCFFHYQMHASNLIFLAPCLLLWFASWLPFAAESFFLNNTNRKKSKTFKRIKTFLIKEKTLAVIFHTALETLLPTQE